MDSKITKFEHFINDFLREQLRELYEEREKVSHQAAEYLQLQRAIQNLQRSVASDESGGKEVRMQVDIGCSFFCQANVPDASKIFVCLGMGIFCEMSHEDAVDFIEKKQQLLQKRIDHLSDQCAEVKARIQIGLQALSELQGLSVSVDQGKGHDPGS
ncbi:protein UXT homolog [Galendromus occidentalis]|uniref:Protein UXT homolog n=1 Tax=Galendromus occidentalis TaxID=34638 RepID=A0AAJ6QZ17_9ACAR|nr:protein UXT homolog [Galendromus occidentalis]